MRLFIFLFSIFISFNSFSETTEYHFYIRISSSYPWHGPYIGKDKTSTTLLLAAQSLCPVLLSHRSSTLSYRGATTTQCDSYSTNPTTGVVTEVYIPFSSRIDTVIFQDDPCKSQTGNLVGSMSVEFSGATVSTISSLIGKKTKFNVVDTETGAKCEAEGTINDCGLLGSIAICTAKNSVVTGNPEYKDNPVLSGAETNKLTDEYKKNIAAGKCPGTVNGVDVWVTCDSVVSTTPSNSGTSTTSTKSDGSTVTTQSTSTTTCKDGSCTTTTTTTDTKKNPDGSDGGTETKTQEKTESKDTFCKENPTFSGCISSEFTSSSCDAAPACTGDAIQCAIAAQSHKSYCDLMVKSTPMAELGLNSANGQLTPEGHPLNSAEQSPFNFASAFNASGGGGCPADVEVMGVVVPLSNTCDGLNALGVAALGISLIWAARIVFAG